jgi:LmbE family N-acetylglucosaminyl deacetylase
MHQDDDRGSSVLIALADAEQRKIDAADIAVVLAHPDDETIACGAQLSRLEGVHVIIVTDGAPRHLKDARVHGCNTVSEYRELRARELRDALALADVGTSQQVSLGIPDQQAAFKLDWLTARLMTLLKARRVRVVLTHAYEGGHPDHDATAFAVHRAAALLGRAGHPISIIEMPIYREKAGQLRPQSFTPYGGLRSIDVRLLPRQVELKVAMCAAHASQADMLAKFALDVERFRSAPNYDFRLPANGGQLLYERFDWGLTGQQWRDIVATVMQRIGTVRG